MRLVYFKAKLGNFGDDLNEWLWPKLFNNISKDTGNYFLGIGSILKKDSTLIKQCGIEKKIVFGSGVRPANDYSNIEFDKTWDIKFLRGPLSAYIFDGAYEYITDSAYALRQISNFEQYQNVSKKYETSLMPYFHSLEYFDWEAICSELGYHYISPLSEQGVEYTIKEIASSKKIITEAMHGAIVADILRVPWHRFVLTTPHTEGERVSDFKWTDWLQSIGIYSNVVTHIPFFRNLPSPKLQKLIPKFITFKLFLKNKTKKNIITKLTNVTKFYLSDDEVLKKIDEQIAHKIESVKAEN